MVAAVIILYNPDLPALNRLLQSIEGQVERTFIIDNTPGSSAGFASYFEKYKLSALYVPLAANKGIATAQNSGIQKSLSAGYSHVLLLDQDSELPSGMVRKLLAAEAKLLKAGESVAAVGPLVVDEKNGKRYGAVRHGWFHTSWISIDISETEPVLTDYLNASGSLIRAAVFEQVGLMLDELFIDAVDTEWGLRCRSRGFNSYVVPTAMMGHSLGDTVVRAFGRDIILHRNIRDYYIVRNTAYLLRVLSMGWRWRLFALVYIPKYIIFHSLLSENTYGSLKLLLRALFDGLSGDIGQIAGGRQVSISASE